MAALETLLIPAMRRSGYDRGFAAALMAAGGGIGIIIPPSMALIVYGVVAEASVVKLFMAGILAGILVGSALMAVTYGTAARAGTKALASAPALPVGRAFRDALWGLLAQGIDGCSVGRVARAALPLIAAEAVVLLLITYLPGLSLWLRRLMN